jgi:class 3 adenylate cyclase
MVRVLNTGDDARAFEDLLRKRGVNVEGNAAVEREILERFQDDCAVLVLDASGFTKLTQTHGIIHYLSLIVALRDMGMPLFERFQTLGAWAVGDNLFAVFPTIRFAVECALALQNAVEKENDGRKEPERLPVCIGIGSGRMLRIGRTDIYGDEMNVASKLGEDIAGPGEVLLTESAYAQAKEVLPRLEAQRRSTHVSGVEIAYFAVDR